MSQNRLAEDPDSVSGVRSNDPFRQKSTRATPTHIFFWGGILSNWHTAGPKFRGDQCYLVLEQQLAALNIPTKYYSQHFSTQLLRKHEFNCGEQWMMACKAWLFEQYSDKVSREGDTMFMSDAEFEKLKQIVMTRQAPTRPKVALSENKFRMVKEMHDSTLAAVLRETKPREQKALGRLVANFDDMVWAGAAVPVVTAACVARAEVDEDLRRLYLACGDRTFVEGSPKDTIWGVGLMWNSKEIEDEANWQGENKLGVCHGNARDIISGNNRER